MKKLIIAAALLLPAISQAELVDLLLTPTTKTPDGSVIESLQNKCGIRSKRIENLSQVSCIQELLGRWFSDNNKGAFDSIFRDYKEADPRARKAQEKGFIEACFESKRKADTYGVDVACSALLKGVLDAGLPRDEFGIVGETTPPPTQAWKPNSIVLGKAGGFEFTLSRESILKTGEIVTGDATAFNDKGAKKQVRYGANCAEKLITEDAGKDLHMSSWSWSSPRFDVENEALKNLCS